MDETAIASYLFATFPGIDSDTATGDSFFFTDPERKFPFATIVTKDTPFDAASQLDRPGVFRLNIGLSKETFRALFGAPAAGPDADFARLDTLMPHPIYGKMHWACVVSPSAATFETAIRPLLDDAYALSVARYGKLPAQD
ncbi:MAG TPA: DUF6194 family protein [Herpetosiphonaceae bacterium]